MLLPTSTSICTKARWAAWSTSILRMIPGGIMLSHDYGLLSGVEKAFQEFFADKPEGIIEQPTTQCMVIKLQGR